MPRNEQQGRKPDRRVQRARQLRRDMTDAERLLWWNLRRLRVGKGHFRRQATVGPYFADFAHHQARLIIELDGSGHMSRETVANDIARTRYLAEQGYRVLRFWNNDILGNTEGVMTVILNALQSEAAPHPLPLPTTRQGARGEGKASPEG